MNTDQTTLQALLGVSPGGPTPAESAALREKLHTAFPNTKTNTMSTTYVPLISSGVAGPLGVLHLPRLWQKLSLEARGVLAPGYPGCGKGYDAMVLGALGITEEAAKSYIGASRPTYPQFEAWVKAQPGAKLDKATIHKLNVSIAGYIHGDDVVSGVLQANGLADDGSVPHDAIGINNLDDWYEFHQAVLK